MGVPRIGIKVVTWIQTLNLMQKLILLISFSVYLLSGCTQDRYQFNLENISSENLKFAPEYYTEKPDLPSPALSEAGRELVTWDRSMMHYIHSVTKSYTSICIGIAIDKGFIKSVHESIFDYLPDYQQYKVDGKEKITIKHLLTMTSGLQWDEWHAPLSSPENDQIGIWFSDEGPIDFILERPLIYEPGTHFTYSGGNMEVLGEILENATGMKIDKFSEKYMFEPLGINSFDWWLVLSSGEIHAAGGLKLTPRDMLKVGVTFLNEGIWNGTRIVSEEWVSKSAETYAGNMGIRIPGEDIGKVGYAYTWWTEEIQHRGEKINMFSANGWGGQKIIVIPELNTAIVFTGGNYISRVKQFKILENCVIPAIE